MTVTKRDPAEVEQLKLQLKRKMSEVSSLKTTVDLLKKEMKMLKAELLKYNMKKIRSKRIFVTLVSKYIFKGEKSIGIIGNLSENGLFMITAPTKPAIDIAPESKIDVQFSLPTNEVMHLKCEVIWTNITPPYYLSNTLGLKIINPPHRYKQFIKAVE